MTDGKFSMKKYVEAAGAILISGYQLRYIYFIDKSKQKDLTVPIIPFYKIDEIGAGMYKGEKVTLTERHIMKGGKKDGQSNGHCDEGNSE